MSILDNIRDHSDLQKLTPAQREQLCAQIRQFLVEKISKTGGHLASNLGIVELAVAVETVFDTAHDRLVFDVGHQSYVHKLLTGRQADFSSLRQFGGMSGFPSPSESRADAFTAGHASSSVSIALGMARARTLSGADYDIVALLGDGAATGGMVYEGLNDAAVSNEPMVVILNDNAMSIDRNVGGMASHLSKLRTKVKYLGMKKKYRNVLSKIPGGSFVFRVTRSIKDRLRRMLIAPTIFESMGFAYLGPVDGHDTEKLISLLQIAKDMRCPVLLHVLTQKGKGYAPAQEHPKLFHGIGKFDPVTGIPEGKAKPTFSDAFGSTMTELAATNDKLCAITAAMPGGTGLLDFKKQFPNRLFDVGIAEEHAVSMAGGLAKQGMVPVVAIYSTFLQRAYDMIMQDIAIQGLHTVFAVDRAGLVGEDGQTHHGVFDLGFLRQVPGMIVLAPASLAELKSMLTWAVNDCTGPVAVRYPKGGDGLYTHDAWNVDLPAVTHKRGTDVAIITYGTLVNQAQEACSYLEQAGTHAGIIRLTQLNPLPADAISALLSGYKYAVVLEESCSGSGLYESIGWQINKRLPACKLTHIDLSDGFVCHGSIEKLYAHYGLDGKSVAKHIQEVLNQ